MAPRHVVVGTAGHIDHGKSALVKALTGTDPDRLPEEKERGITLDLGFAHAEWDGVTYSFVDVPGHEKLVRTMVAGATGIDVALLAVASDDGPMPQTREHLAILGLLGVSTGLLVRTKADLADAETGELVEEEMRSLAAGTFLEKAPLVAVSTVTGAGLPELREALARAVSGVKPRDPGRAPVRLFIDRVFTMKGFGPVVTGTLDSGRIEDEDRLALVPDGVEVRVRRVEVHGSERAWAEAGERTSLNLAGIERAALTRGQALVAPGTLVPSTLLTVEVDVLPSLAGPLRDGLAVRLSLGTADVEARLHSVATAPDAPAKPAPPDGSSEPPFRPGVRGVAQLTTGEPVAARRGDRFILRRPSPAETLGGGRVLDTAWPRVRRRQPLPAASARLLAGPDERALSRLLLGASGPAGITARSLASRVGIHEEVAAAHLEALAKGGEALRISPQLFAASTAAAEMARRFQAVFAERKKAGAPTLLVPRKELLEKVARGLSPSTAEGWLVSLAAAGKVAVAGDQAGPPGSGTKSLSDDAGGFASRIAEAYLAGGFEIPASQEIARALGTKPAVVEGLVSHLLKTNVLVRLSPDVVVHRETVDRVVAKLGAVKGQTLGVAAFRDLLGLTRKNLIPLLEHLDRLKKTRRVGDQRVVD